MASTHKTGIHLQQTRLAAIPILPNLSLSSMFIQTPNCLEIPQIITNTSTMERDSVSMLISNQTLIKDSLMDLDSAFDSLKLANGVPKTMVDTESSSSDSAITELSNEIHLDAGSNNQGDVPRDIPTSTEANSSGKLHKVQDTDGKGLGMFAVQSTPRGTVILEEPPLLRLDRTTWRPKYVKREFRAMTPEDQEKFMSLFSIHGLIEPLRTSPNEDPIKEKRAQAKRRARARKESSILSVWFTNCMAAGDSDGVFYESSRINHSCIPNAHYAWNDKKGMQQIRAVKDIQPEEVSDSFSSCAYEIMPVFPL
jgi:hypothetical protein